MFSPVYGSLSTRGLTQAIARGIMVIRMGDRPPPERPESGAGDTQMSHDADSNRDSNKVNDSKNKPRQHRSNWDEINDRFSKAK